MRVWTYGEALDKVNLEFDLTNEPFISADEMAGLFNDAVQKASAEIQKLGVEDEYFSKKAFISLVNGTALYSLPADIYANKIRGIVYSSGTDIYPVNRLRRRNKYAYKEEINQFIQSADYQYDIINSDVDTGYQLELVPPARETSSLVMKMAYIREAKYIPLPSVGSLAASRAIKVDLPTFMTYIFAHVKWKIAEKIPHPNLQAYKDDADIEKALMIETLTEMVVDDATEVEPDLSHYERSS